MRKLAKRKQWNIDWREVEQHIKLLMPCAERILKDFLEKDPRWRGVIRSERYPPLIFIALHLHPSAYPKRNSVMYVGASPWPEHCAVIPDEDADIAANMMVEIMSSGTNVRSHLWKEDGVLMYKIKVADIRQFEIKSDYTLR